MLFNNYKNKHQNNLFSNAEKEKVLLAVVDFASSNEKLLNRSFLKKKKLNKFEESIKKEIFSTLDKAYIPSKTTTQPDELTSILLEKLYSHPIKDRKKIMQYYLNQKQLEMKIGNLLELYIQRRGLDFNWFCTGKIVKNADFIKKQQNGWLLLQVKNSDNTENNAASQVRDGTTMDIWQRRNSKKKGLYYWKHFPDPKLSKILNEKDFRGFIDQYYSGIKIIS